MIRTIKRLALAGLAAATLTALAVGPASASVTIDPATGTGFVGKGDVQTAFGWNNATFQAQARNLVFTSVSTTTWEYDEVWDTGIGTKGYKHHVVSQTSTTSVNASLAYDTRNRNQVTGLFLNGYNGAPIVEGIVPVEGQVLVDPQNPTPSPTDHIAQNVVQTGSTGPQLYVADPFLGLSPVAIPAPAPAV